MKSISGRENAGHQARATNRRGALPIDIAVSVVMRRVLLGDIATDADIANRQTVIDMAAIVEIAAVAEPVFMDDGTGAIHERRGLAPSRLIEVAGRAIMMAGVRDVAATGEAADSLRLITMRGEISDQRLETASEVRRYSDRSGCGLHCNQASS